MVACILLYVIKYERLFLTAIRQCFTFAWVVFTHECPKPNQHNYFARITCHIRHKQCNEAIRIRKKASSAGETRASVLLLGLESGATFLNQLQSIVKKNQSNENRSKICTKVKGNIGKQGRSIFIFGTFAYFWNWKCRNSSVGLMEGPHVLEYIELRTNQSQPWVVFTTFI